jgi:hypothetical protein
MDEDEEIVSYFSGREFNPSKAGGQIHKPTSARIKFTQRGVEVVAKHLNR